MQAIRILANGAHLRLFGDLGPVRFGFVEDMNHLK
jgi:hypothetical protein